MIPCFDVPVIVDRVEDEGDGVIVVVEIAGVTVDLPGITGLHEGDELRLCVPVSAWAAAPLRPTVPSPLTPLANAER